MGSIDLGSLLQPALSSDVKDESPSKTKKISEAIDILGTASAPATPGTPSATDPLPVSTTNVGYTTITGNTRIQTCYFDTFTQYMHVMKGIGL